jgi:hypothetical protein
MRRDPGGGNRLRGSGRLRCISTLLLPGLIALSACRSGAAEPPLPDLSYLPADTSFAAFVDSRRMQEAPIYADLTSGEGPDSERWAEVREFLNHLGVEPEKDLDSVMFAYRAPDGADPEWVVVLRGRFEASRIEEGLAEPGARMSSEEVRGHVIHNLVEVPQVGDLSLVIVDPTAVALGKAGALRKVLEARDRPAESLASNREMRRMVEALDRWAQVRAVLDGRGISRMVAGDAGEDTQPPPMFGGLSSVRSGKFSATLTRDIALVLEVENQSERHAQTLAEALRGLLAIGRMGSERSDPESAGLLDAIQVDTDETAMRVRLHLEGDEVRRLRRKYGAAIPAPAAPGP